MLKLKKMIISIIAAIICGAISGNLVYYVYNEKVNKELNQNKVYLLEYGDYNDLESLNNDKYNSKYLYFFDNDNYKKVLGITKKEANIKKIKSLYDEDLLISTYYLNNDNLNSKINDYDQMLNSASSKEEIQDIINLTLELYNNNDHNTLAKR